MNTSEHNKPVYSTTAHTAHLHTNNHASPAPNNQSMVDIRVCLTHHFDAYFKNLDGETPSQMHDMMLAVCEKPLLEWVMKKTRGNQSMASDWLGINRATLRKKLLQHELMR